MRFNSLFASSLLIAALSAGLVDQAFAQAGNSAADVATIRDYTLTTGFLKKWEAMATDPAAPSCSLMILNLQGDSLNEMIANYDARPGNHAYLSSHGLSSRDMVLGSSALAAAAAQQLQRAHPEYAEGDASGLVSPKNLAFYEAHKGEIHALMQKAGSDRLRRNGGKLTDCSASG